MTNLEKAKQAAEEAMQKLAAALEALTNAGGTEKSPLSELKPGEKFKTEIGNFIVLDQFKEEALVITEKLFLEDVQFSDDTTDYNESSLKEKMEEVYQQFANVFGAENIVEHEADLTSVDGQQLYENPIVKVRPMTFDEARKYNQYLPNAELDDLYWTITPWSSKERGWGYYIAVVAPSGIVRNDDCNGNGGVRPVCILKSNIFVSKED